MRSTRAGRALVAAAVLLGLLLPVGPAASADEVETPEIPSAAVVITVTVPERGPGELIWELDGGNDLVDLGVGTGHGDHVAATGTLNEIRVKDTRQEGSAWTISGQVSDFSNGEVTAPAKYLGWTPFVHDNGIAAVAGPSVASGFDSGEGLSRARGLASGADSAQIGSVVLGAELDFKIPHTLGSGTFRALLTLTALT